MRQSELNQETEQWDALDDEEALAAQAPSVQRMVVAHDSPLRGLRLDKALAALLCGPSRSRIAQWIDAGCVTLNGQVAKARDKVASGDVIDVDQPFEVRDQALKPESMPLEIVYEDASILVLNKPASLVVHPAPGHWSGTLVNGLLAYDSSLGALPRAGIVHRLDADTTGLMVVARTLPAHASLVAQLQARSVHREYWAVVYGHVADQGIVEASIARDRRNRLRFRTSKSLTATGAKEACTLFRCVARTQLGRLKLSWLAVKLRTGRTHQIRVHMESVGHPLVGDRLYGLHRPALEAQLGDRVAEFGRQALHAARLGLVHPQTQAPIVWSVLPPPDMGALMRELGFDVPRSVQSFFSDGGSMEDMS